MIFEAVEIGEKQKPQGAFAFFGTKAIGGLSSAEDQAKEKSERGIGLEDLAGTKTKDPNEPGEQSQESRRGDPARAMCPLMPSARAQFSFRYG